PPGAGPVPPRGPRPSPEARRAAGTLCPTPRPAGPDIPTRWSSLGSNSGAAEPGLSRRAFPRPPGRSGGADGARRRGPREGGHHFAPARAAEGGVDAGVRLRNIDGHNRHSAGQVRGTGPPVAAGSTRTWRPPAALTAPPVGPLRGQAGASFSRPVAAGQAHAAG